MNLNIINLGTMEYGRALGIQEKLLALRQQGLICDCLLLVEHPPVLTMGNRAKDYNILVPRQFLEDAGVSIYDITRGGDVTYHGPGQIVGYPIMDLNGYGKSIRDFVNNLKAVFIRLLDEEFGLSAYGGEKEYTGVWVGNDKITAIGLAVKKWVTMHGFAFNVNTNLEHFEWITPCGLADRGVTSLQKLLGRQLDFEEANQLVIKYFCEIFNMQPVICDLAEVIKEEPLDE